MYACKGARGTGNFVEKFAELAHAKNSGIVVYGYNGLLGRSTGSGAKMGKLDTGPFLTKKASSFRIPYAMKSPDLPEEDDEGPVAWQGPGAMGGNAFVNPLWKANKK